MEQVGQLTEDAIDHGAGGTIQQARTAALGSRVLGNQRGGEFEVEITEGEFAGGGGKSGHASGPDRPVRSWKAWIVRTWFGFAHVEDKNAGLAWLLRLLAFNLVNDALACPAALAVSVSSFRVMNTYTFDEIIEFQMTRIRIQRTRCPRTKISF
jgi:hypothetical protein